MATVNVMQYEKYEPNGFQPGATVTWFWGPWDWQKKGVTVTAHPFDTSTSDRALAVTEIRRHNTPASGAADKWVEATVRNVGKDPIYIYYVTLVESAS